MSSSALNKRGLTLIEVMVAIAIATVVLLVAVSAFNDQSTLQSRLLQSSQRETDRRILSHALEKATHSVIADRIWVNKEVLAAMGIPMTDTTTGAPWLDPAATAADGPIRVATAHRLHATVPPAALALTVQAITAPAEIKTDLALFFQRNPEKQDMVISSVTSLAGTPFESDATATSGYMNFAVDPSPYGVNSVLAIASFAGVEFVKITSFSGPTQLRFDTLGTYNVGTGMMNLPAPYLPSGTPVYAVKAVLAGRQDNDDHLVIYQLTQSTTPIQLIVSSPAAVTSGNIVLASTLVPPSPLLGLYILAPQSSPYVFRWQWASSTSLTPSVMVIPL